MKLCQILYDLHYYLLLGRGFFGFFIWCKLFLVGHDVFFLIFMNNSLSVNPAKEITKAKHSMKICWMHSLDHHQKYHNTAVTHKVGGGGVFMPGGAVPGRSPFFNCLQVLKGSTWETFNKRANLIKHEWRFIRPTPCFVIPLVVWILDETLLLVLAIPYRAIIPRQIENNAYANFWRKSKEYYSTLEKVYKAFLHDVTAAKTMKLRPCWCSKPILWELNSFLVLTLSFVPINRPFHGFRRHLDE